MVATLERNGCSSLWIDRCGPLTFQCQALATTRPLKPRGRDADDGRMRHFRLWLLVIGLVSLVAEAIAAAAVFWHGGAPRRS